MSSKPTVNIVNTPAQIISAVEPYKVLIIGQMLSTGTGTAGIIKENINNYGEEDALFGINSHLASMIRNFKAINKYSRLDVLPLADSSAVGKAKTKKSITITGTVSDGTLEIIIFGKSYEVPVVAGDTISGIVDDIISKVALDTKARFVATNNSGVLELEYRHYGTVGNDFPIVINTDIKGFTFTIATITAGAENPTFDATNLLNKRRYHRIICPIEYETEITSLVNILETRSNIEDYKLGGFLLSGKVDTLANFMTTNAYGTKRVFNILGTKKIDTSIWKGSETKYAMSDLIAELGGLTSLKLTEGAPLSSRIPANNRPKDAIGGWDLVALPYHNMLLDIEPLDYDNSFTDEDLEVLKANGYATITNNDANNGVIIRNFVTTYLTTPSGASDITYDRQETCDQVMFCGDYFFSKTKTEYANMRFVTDGDITYEGQLNKQSIKARSLEWAYQIATPEFPILDQNNMGEFEKNIEIITNKATGNIKYFTKLPISGFLNSVDFGFQTLIS